MKTLVATSTAKAENASFVAPRVRGKGVVDKLLVGSITEAVTRKADRRILALG